EVRPWCAWTGHDESGGAAAASQDAADSLFARARRLWYQRDEIPNETPCRSAGQLRWLPLPQNCCPLRWFRWAGRALLSERGSRCRRTTDRLCGETPHCGRTPPGFLTR